VSRTGRWPRWVAGGAATILLLVALAWGPIEVGLRAPSPSPVSEPQVWAHRGYHERAPENSLDALRAAFSGGAPGVELDLHYLPESSTFLVAHDAPQGASDGDALRLREVFDALGPAGYFWLDLKNLTPENVETVVPRLVEVVTEAGVADLVFVEVSGLGVARAMTGAGLRTIYSVVNPYRLGLLARWRTWLYYSVVAATTDIEGWSVEATLVDRPFLARFGRRPLFVYTVNEREEVERWLDTEPIAVVLSDRPHWR